MSDGPHRSLPLSPRWRKVSARLENDACSETEFVDEIQYALTQDFRELPETWRRPVLLQTEPIGNGTAPPKRLEIILVEQRERPENKGVPSGASHRRVVATALRIFGEEQLRAVKEHWYRELPSAGARRLETRMQGSWGKCDCAALADEIVSHASGGSSPPPPRRQTGLNKGPRL